MRKKTTKASAVAIMLVILLQFCPQDSGNSQINNDSVLSLENQALFHIRNEMMDSICTKTARVHYKQSRIKIKDTPTGKKVIYIHDTVYLPFWKSIPHLFKSKK